MYHLVVSSLYFIEYYGIWRLFSIQVRKINFDILGKSQEELGGNSTYIFFIGAVSSIMATLTTHPFDAIRVIIVF